MTSYTCYFRGLFHKPWHIRIPKKTTRDSMESIQPPVFSYGNSHATHAGRVLKIPKSCFFLGLWRFSGLDFAAPKNANLGFHFAYLEDPGVIQVYMFRCVSYEVVPGIILTNPGGQDLHPTKHSKPYEKKHQFCSHFGQLWHVNTNVQFRKKNWCSGYRLFRGVH